MLKGTIIHTARMRGDRFIDFEPFELAPKYPGIGRIEVASREENVISVHTEFTSVASRETARVLAQGISQRVLDFLAFHYSLHIEKYGPPAETLVDQAFNGAYLTAAGFVLSGGEASFRLGLGPPTIAAIRAQLEGPDLPRESYYSQFRTALQTQDPVDRFMALYRLLLHLIPDIKGKESQAAVDEFIIREFGAPTTPRPGKPEIRETAYSRLRNEIGHVRPNVDLTSTRAEIEQHVKTLVDVVKRAISQLP